MTPHDVLVHIVRDAVARVDATEDQLLAPEPAALFRLLQRPPAWVAPEDRQELRESTEEFTVVLSDLGALQERIKLLQEEIAAQINEGNNRSLSC